mmetsp:Transcript_14575/g.32841  ORF Transcript_14575/g.32841 Transcript_14575/m.32841 type:complete len:231 (+) Transcript_14575:1304-1996(+)
MNNAAGPSCSEGKPWRRGPRKFLFELFRHAQFKQDFRDSKKVSQPLVGWFLGASRWFVHVCHVDFSSSLSFCGLFAQNFAVFSIVVVFVAVDDIHVAKPSKLGGTLQTLVHELEEKLSAISVVVGSVPSLFVLFRIPAVVQQRQTNLEPVAHGEMRLDRRVVPGVVLHLGNTKSQLQWQARHFGRFSVQWHVFFFVASAYRARFRLGKDGRIQWIVAIFAVDEVPCRYRG